MTTLLSLLSVNGWKQLLSRIWPYLLLIVVTVFTYMYVEHKWQQDMQTRYDSGVEAGKKQVVDEYENKSALIRNNWAIDKEKLEYEAQQRLNIAKADAVKSRVIADSLRGTLSEIRSAINQAGVSVSPGASAREAVYLLTNLLEQSNDRANKYAEFADAAFEAGRTCELQYDKVRDAI